MFLSIVMDVSKSLSLNSYKMFQPKGPNFLLSYMMAWKKERLKSSFFQALGFEMTGKNLPWCKTRVFLE
jgi:hypothetical protein